MVDLEIDLQAGNLPGALFNQARFYARNERETKMDSAESNFKGEQVALPWYERKSYNLILSMLPASERQDPLTYDAFMAKMERHEQLLQRSGAIPRRIPMDAVTIKEWCDANNLRVCRASLSEYSMICLGLKVTFGDTRN